MGSLSTSVSLSSVCKDLLDAEARVADLKEALEDAKAVEKERREAAARSFIQSGVSKMTVDGRTLYLRTDAYCSKRADVESEVACEVLRGNDLGDFVSVQPQTQRVKAWAREQITAAREANPVADPKAVLPSWFFDNFNLYEETRVVSRKA
jgi:hypothetical protein